MFWTPNLEILIQRQTQHKRRTHPNLTMNLNRALQFLRHQIIHDMQQWVGCVPRTILASCIFLNGA
jgi:hypothetical protein